MLNPASVDLAVEFPKELWEEKDEINHRYFHKRAFFLAKIAEAVRGIPSLKDATLRWETTRGHILRPFLCVIPGDKNGLKINIHVSLDVSVIKKHRLGPGRNSVRGAALVQTDTFRSENSASSSSDLPTPIYNSLLAMDILMIEHMKMIHTELRRIPAFSEAIKLVKAWLLQRGFNHYSFAPSGFQLSMLLVYLAKVNLIDASFNELQIVKALFTWLHKGSAAETLFALLPLNKIAQGVPEDCQREFSAEIYKNTFAISLVEPILGMNLFFDWTPEMTSLLRFEASRSLVVLEGESDLDSLFLRPDIPEIKFDAHFIIRDFKWMPDFKANVVHYANQWQPEAARLKMISKKLSFALNTRSDSIFVARLKPSSFGDLSEFSPSAPITNSSYLIGLKVNREEVNRIVQLGPLATEEVEAKAFRIFWRERAELRRFPDSSIREAVAWDHLSDARHLVLPDVIQFVFEKHFGCSTVKGMDWGSITSICTLSLSFTSVQEAFDSLSKRLKGLRDLPLSVNQCELIAAEGRYTSVVVPEAIHSEDLNGAINAFSKTTPIMEVLIYLESSSRWPEDYYGLLYAKQTFSVEICQKLQDEHGIATSITNEYFDVFNHGFIFRCRIHQSDEVSLRRKQGMDADDLEMLFEHRPKLSRALSALAHENSIFGPTCRLLKRIIGMAFLSNQAPDEIVELLCAKIFLEKMAPSSVINGLTRVLSLLSSAAATSDSGLIVDFTRSIPPVTLPATAESGLGLRIGVIFDGPGGILHHWGCINGETLEDIKKMSHAILIELNSTRQLVIPSLDPRDFIVAMKIAKEIPMSSRVTQMIGRNSIDSRFLRCLPGLDIQERIITDIHQMAKNFNEKVRLFYDRYDPQLIFLNLPDGTDLRPLKETINNKFGSIIEFI